VKGTTVTDAAIDRDHEVLELPGMPARPEPGPSAADEARERVEAALVATVQMLAQKRAARDGLNAEIRELVADEELLRQSLRPFTRRRSGNAEA